MTAVDLDESMLKVLKEKYATADIEFFCDDISMWLAKQSQLYEIIFSNTTFHWFGSHQAILEVLQNCHRLLVSGGVLAVRFLLKENALEIKRYLENRLEEFLREKDSPYLKQSELDYTRIVQLLSDVGFDLQEAEELRYTPFEDSLWDFKFMEKSQPIHQYFNEQSFQEFRNYLEDCWRESKVRLTSHHGLFIGKKS